MAVVKFDPVSYPKYFKIIPDNATPAVFYLLSKPIKTIKQASATSLLIYDGSGTGTAIATTGADAIDADGNTLSTAATQLTYIVQNSL